MSRNWMKKAAAVLMAVSLLVSGITVPGNVQAKAKPKLNKKNVTLKVGKTVSLKLKNAKKKVVWSSSKKSVAVVSKKGKVTAKKVGSAKIIAKSAGKKYTCKVTVKKADDSSDPSATQKPDETAKPSASPGAAPNFPNQATTTSSHVRPATAAEDTLAVGNLNVTLGASKSEVEAKIAAKPDRTESTPLGFDSYIYNPSLDYSNYTQIQFDNDRAVCITTMSKYFRYENLVAADEDTAATLQEKGFKSMKSGYDYEAGYVYTSDTEYVTAFVDHQGSGKVYAVGVYSKKTSQSDSTKLDNLSKAEYGTYGAAANEIMAKELFDWACVFREVKGLKAFSAYNSNSAQLYSESLAAKDSIDKDPNWKKRFYDTYDCIGCAECCSSRSLDAFGFITFWVDNTESGAYANLIRTTDNTGIELGAYYLCTGFASNSASKDITFAVLDMFYY